MFHGARGAERATQNAEQNLRSLAGHSPSGIALAHDAVLRKRLEARGGRWVVCGRRAEGGAETALTSRGIILPSRGTRPGDHCTAETVDSEVVSLDRLVLARSLLPASARCRRRGAAPIPFTPPPPPGSSTCPRRCRRDSRPAARRACPSRRRLPRRARRRRRRRRPC